MTNSDHVIKEVESILEEYTIPKKEFDLKAFRKIMHENNILSFKKLVDYNGEKDIYLGIKNIPFQNKPREFMRTMLSEFI